MNSTSFWNSRIDIVNKFGVFAGSLLVALAAVYIWSPILRLNAEDAVSRVSVKSNSVISLTLDTDALNFSLVPTETGAFSSQAITATIETNSITGYELYFSSEDNSTDMTATGIDTVISSDFEGTVTSSTMERDNWGYSIDNVSFSKIPTLENQATIRNLNRLPSAAEKITPIYIGTKVSTNTTAGAYTKSVKISTVAHETPDLPFSGIRNMQEMTPAVCENASIDDTATLSDTRDGKTYTIKKLKDGKCWMTQDLVVNNKTITSADSNLPDGESFEVTTNDGTGLYLYNVMTAGWNVDGIFYGSSPKDICPKGWRLPVGTGTRGEIVKLYSYYDSLDAWVSDGNWPYDHSYRLATINDARFFGFYADSDDMRLNIGSGSRVDEYIGTSASHIRCVAKGGVTINNIANMQDITPEIVADTALYESAILIDNRDYNGNSYRVKKLADGSIWMTENLRIENKTITSADSNLPDNVSYTIPASKISSFKSLSSTNVQNTNAVYVDPVYGGYYNFNTATVGQGGSRASGYIHRDICPKNWRLPRGGSKIESGVSERAGDGELKRIYNNYYDSSALMLDVPAFSLSGVVYSGSAHEQGTKGYYWSSTATSGPNASALSLTDSEVSPTLFSKKGYGYAVRCVDNWWGIPGR